jgi:excisionase family DNA binding protein
MSMPQPQAQPRLVYTPTEAARLISVSRARVFELLAAGELEGFLHGRKRYIRHEALVAYIDRIEAEADPGAKFPAPKG